MRQLRKKTETRRFLAEGRQFLNPDIELGYLLQDWDDPYNVGGLFRVADACGAAWVYGTGKTPMPPHPQVSVTSLGNHRRVEHRHFARTDEAIAAIKEEGFTLVAVEVADNAVPYKQVELTGKICLVLGNEARGMYPATLKACDQAVFIPMAGKGRSLNVHVAAAIVAYDLLTR